MKIRLILTASLLFVLIGCDLVSTTTTAMTTSTTTTSTTTTTTTITTTTTATTLPLGVPDGIVLAGAVLSWNPVTEAGYYELEINGVVTMLARTTYDMTDYPDAVYSIRVKAVAGSRNSGFSELVEVTLLLHPEIPWGLLITDDVLTWNETPGAIGYEVLYGETALPVTENSYDLLTLPENALYTLSVRSVFAYDVKSGLSVSMFYHSYHEPYSAFGFRFNKNAAEAFSVNLTGESLCIDGVLAWDGSLLEEAAYTIVDEIITISSEYLLTVPYGERILLILTSAGFVTLEIEVVDDRQPYMISLSNVTFTGVDVILDFEVYDGLIVNLSGNGITAADYRIEGSHVTINAAYIAGKFSENPDRVTLILGYYLSANDHITIGYVFIKLPV